MAVKRVAHPSVADRRARGLEARDRAPLSSHDGWAPAAGRPDPVGLLQDQDAYREPDLVPVRHGRMLVSPLRTQRPASIQPLKLRAYLASGSCGPIRSWLRKLLSSAPVMRRSRRFCA